MKKADDKKERNPERLFYVVKPRKCGMTTMTMQWARAMMQLGYKVAFIDVEMKNSSSKNSGVLPCHR